MEQHSLEDWLKSVDYRVRLVVISAERLLDLAADQGTRSFILNELELLHRRTGDAIQAIEAEPDWRPGANLCPP